MNWTDKKKRKNCEVTIKENPNREIHKNPLPRQKNWKHGPQEREEWGVRYAEGTAARRSRRSLEGGGIRW